LRAARGWHALGTHFDARKVPNAGRILVLAFTKCRIERMSLLSLGWANVARDVQMPKGLLVLVASEMDRILTSGEALEIKAGGF
jgi:hypothetical protein